METINHECYVSLGVAKLLKEAGFDWECYELYEREYEQDGRVHAVTSANWNSSLKYYSAPTLEVAQRWLREIKNVVLLVDFNNDEDCEENERYGVTIYIAKERIIELATYPTYEEALETGIKKALEMILEKGE